MALGKFQRIELVPQKPRGFIESTRIIGRKRVVVMNEMENSNLYSPCSTPSQKRRGRKTPPLEQTSRLESLPQDLLVRILCKVTHGDLKQLLLVSKFVNEATVIAKEMHFAYSTPLSKPMFNKFDELGLCNSEDSGEAPNAPRQYRIAKSRIDGDKLASLAVALFSSED